LLRDDGAAVYLNGVEIFRSNLPGGPIAYDTLATFAVGGEEETTLFVTGTVNSVPLRAGLNVVAVEVHQINPASSDLSFALELLAETGGEPLPVYVVTELGALPGGQESEASALNDLGHVVGSSSTATSLARAFRFAYGRMTELVAPTPHRSFAHAINNRGTVLGSFDLDSIGDREVPFIIQDGTLQTLAALTGVSNFNAQGLNEADHLAGMLFGTAFKAVVFRDGQLVTLTGLPGSTADDAVAINEQGLLAGVSRPPA
jgi:probable HAF family extracellular repeat protein